ncbi:efflux transporter outer membrane subunit [Novosphingobium sediminicola]|uniref:NodT family efflux transporter outer membrane factor (OMF) lipoprotein n=1 Tax=Novosphingobium sediminicola TaxID=563162 RepID=A0A7W6G693_9SPHN|nr:efflux transporter outer membrane subunit [Novosphingobium sediminicola]MBB3953727.1 NodT family efflux transporter outer membrane factor (OMF) lipoprotein [Novosphingobium sediminicola]
MRKPRFLAALMVASALTGACSMAPHAGVPPVAPPPAAFKETGLWTPAMPADAAPRGAWWSILPDPVLDGLEQRIEKDSPRLAAALARYDQARALTRQARADLLPRVDASGRAMSARAMSPATGGHYEYDDYAVGGSALYEVDLWGRIRNQVSASAAEAQASEADLAGARLSLQAELADDYIQLRKLDAQLDLLRQTKTAYAAAVDLTTKRFVGGAANEADVTRARTQFKSVQSEMAQRSADRAMLEHAIAALVGEQASGFAIAPVAVMLAPPQVPVSAPSMLLQRRPDVAAAARRVAGANAKIGVARAAFFPQVTLGASGGFETTAASLLTAGSSVWALGPALAAMPIFDGGRRRAGVAYARAQFAEASANYRQATLNAFREVEDQLALVNRLAEASAQQSEAVVAAARTNQLANIQYREGAVDYLQVVTAQAAELQAREDQLALESRRLIASIGLIRAMGGDWRGS